MTARNSVTTFRQRLVIVDPCLDDYQCLAKSARKRRMRFTLTSTGRGALRLLPSFSDACWLLSPQLPDMCGIDLLEMLLSLQPKLKAAIVDSQYHHQREQLALQLGANQYLCKPVQLSWIDAWKGLPIGVHDFRSSDPETVEKAS